LAVTATQVEEDLASLPEATAPARRLQERVLLIEDSEDAAFLVRHALKEHGDGKYCLEWSSTLSGGLGQLSKGGVDLVLLDLGLPESSGTTSYTSVRERAPDVPVVVLTADASAETQSSVFASGAEGYLIKQQISGLILLKAIGTALHAKRLRPINLKTRKIDGFVPEWHNPGTKLNKHRF
jgi:DNA-binding NarL/FixJ family response regulator